jgi:RNA polymerase sigma factor (sigma-70 family)
MYGSASDSELIERALRSDRGAFAALFGRHGKAVYHYAWGLTRDRGDAEDMTQDVFLTAWKKLRDLRIVDASALPWLLVTTRNHALNLSRKRRANLPLDESQVASTDERREELHWVLAEVAKLGGTDQRLVQLCLIEGYGYSDAARRLGLSTSAVAKRIERLRSALRAAVGGES